MMEPCSHRFTAAEGGARLAATAAAGNTLVTECGAFIATRLLHEEAYNIRGLLSMGRQRSIYIGRAANVKPDAYELSVLTDLKVTQAVGVQDVEDWSQELETKEVVVCTSEVFHHILARGLLAMSQVNVLVIDSCHLIYHDEDLQYIMRVYKQTDERNRPRILAITYPLFTSPKTIDKTEKTIDNTDKNTDKENAITVLNETSDEAVIIDKKSEMKRVNELGVNDNLDDFEMYEKLEYIIDELEKELCCRMDLAEDIDGCKRISGPTTKPKEVLIEYESRQPEERLPREYTRLETYMRDSVGEVMNFLEDHRHDPTEIYGEELYDEFKNIPDPTVEPRQILKEFLYILDQLGPYAADKAAFSLLIKLEKLKIKVPYERHFLLLRLCTTTLVKIRCYTAEMWENIDSDWEKIRQFSTPKVLRLVEILEKFTPPDLKASIENNTFKFERHFDNDDNDNVNNDVNKSESVNNDMNKTESVNNDMNKTESVNNDVNKSDSVNNDDVDVTKKMLRTIEGCDFTSLGDKIEDRINVMTGNLKDLDEFHGKNPEINENNRLTAMKNQAPADSKPLWCRRGGRTRTRRMPRATRAALQSNPDALCGVVYVKEPLVAKTLFMLIVDITRCHPAVSYINSQYCCVEPVEHSESQQQGRRHEEVLKKFRMHECNLLLTTSALEEGIDLPRCNLVLRWDEPPSYRSYVLCRARCRAARGGAAVLGAAPRAQQLLHCLATYKELDQIITRKCGCGVQDEPSAEEESHADKFNALIKPYSPNDSLPPCHCGKKIISIANSMKRTISDSENDHLDSELIEESHSGNNDSEKSHSGNNDSEKSHSGNNDSGKIHSVNNESEKIHSVNNESEKIHSVNNECDKSNCEIDSENNAKDNSESVVSNKCLCVKYNDSDNVASVDLNSAIALINRYCAKLPSDTFTRLAPQWWVERVRIPGTAQAFVCTLRLPLNCPVKYNIVGHPMPTRVLARRMVALQACRILHKSGELDNQLMPIGKENFKAMELETSQCVSDASCENDAARPGTTKRRQYYYKRTAWAFTDCQPVVDTSDTELENPDCTDSRKADSGKPNCTDSEKLNCTDSEKLNCTDSRKNDSTDSKTPGINEKRDKTESEKTCDDSNNAGLTESETICKKSEAINNNDTQNPGPTESETGSDESETTGNTDSNTGDIPDKTEFPGKKETAQPLLDEESSKTRGGNDANNEKKYTGRKRNMLYAIDCSLWCALPERYNTRGRRLHAPQHATQALAILMARDEPTNLQIPAFPVYTRSGEVRVSVEHIPDADVRVSPRRGRLVRRFMRFVFAEVLRVRRRGMQLHNERTNRNNYYIVPTIKTIKDGTQKIDIDWTFLEQIYNHTELQKLCPDKPLLWHLDDEELMKERDGNSCEGDTNVPLRNPLLKEGEVFVFDPEHYKEAVVTPWYRNQDQPQFFLVAEICWNLTPDSAFPSATHDTFRSYYRAKYKVELTQPNQPLLDVDHTSARLNLLTPRYVNRKGVALPVSSERTRRAKRDRLDQKQILVPELCTVHPFAAPLWFATVALPCVLYRINALLIADEIRRAVAIDVGLGIPKIDDTTMPGFQWPPLDFGWCLAEVLSADEKTVIKKDDDSENDASQIEEEVRSVEAPKADNAEDTSESKEKTINDILQEEHEKLNQEDAESGFEIGTWSNDMASSIPDEAEYDELLEPLPPNLTFCTSANGGVNWCDPVQKPKPQNEFTSPYTMADSDCSYMSSDFDSDDSDLECSGTDTDAESGFGSNKGVSAALGVRIEYKTAHEAEAVDLESANKGPSSPARDPAEEALAAAELMELLRSPRADPQYIENFRTAVENHKQTITKNGQFIAKDSQICELLPETKDNTLINDKTVDIKDIFPRSDEINTIDGQISIENIEKNKRKLLKDLKNSLTDKEISELNCFYMKDINIDDPNYINEKIANVGFDRKEKYINRVVNNERVYKPYFEDDTAQNGKVFDFDYQPDLDGHPGPSPSVILQALTMSNANDGINLERLETIGDSFLKFAITAYLYCAHPTVHEGKLSHMRSKQVSNLNLYRLGRAARLGSRMIASKFEPHDNWLPPCHRAPPSPPPAQLLPHHKAQTQDLKIERQEATGCYIPYNLITQHSIPDKSIADCVEALIGAYLLWCGPRGALLFMAWLGISVLPAHLHQTTAPTESVGRDSSGRGCRAGVVQPPGARRPCRDDQGNWYQIVYGALAAPPSPLLQHVPDPHGELQRMLSGYDALEDTLQYRFKDRSLLLQALTHASHQRNTLTDCYQRLEFLGDAILDYLITRHLYEDKRRHSPGALTDLRSALVNNTIFATLAVRHGFHKYFRHMSPGLNEVLLKYVRIQEENGHSISEEHYLIQEDELEQAEDVEVPKALGDLFESIAGAIFLDSGMSLGTVWRSYERLMGAELEAFSAAAPKSPVRELLEAEPDTAKFGKPERLADGRRVRVCVEVFGRGTFKGIGRNYRIAKGTAARCALRHLKKHRR